MNTLSWILYLADVSSGLSGLLGASAAMLGIGTVVAIFAGIAMYGTSEEEISSIGKRLLKISVISAISALFLAIVSLLIPSKQTILMVAASEMGEAVIKTPEAQEVFADLKIILKQQIEGLKNK